MMVGVWNECIFDGCKESGVVEVVSCEIALVLVVL